VIDQNKKDIHNRLRDFNSARAKLEQNEFPIPENKELILRFIRDCRLGKTLKNRQKKVIGEARCLKYIQILKKLSGWFSKPFDKVTQNDMERVVENLESNYYTYSSTLKNGEHTKPKPLAHSTKLDYKKTLIKFYKWLYGANKYVPELVDWIDTYDIVKEIPAIRRELIERLAQSLPIRDKAIIMFLFDGGPRAEEFLNIKIRDLTKSDGIYKVRIVHSKTKPRTIHLPIASTYIDMWLNYNEGRDPDEYLFPMTYDALRIMLHRVGKKILKKSITPHLLRHSSATYYANLLNHQQLCYRYGWTMASNMPNRYLDREGIFEKETVDVVKKNDLSNFEDKNKKLEEEISMLKHTNQNILDEFKELSNKYNDIFQGKNFMSLLKSFAQNKEEKEKGVEVFYGKEFDFIVSKD